MSDPKADDNLEALAREMERLREYEKESLAWSARHERDLALLLKLMHDIGRRINNPMVLRAVSAASFQDTFHTAMRSNDVRTMADVLASTPPDLLADYVPARRPLRAPATC